MRRKFGIPLFALLGILSIAAISCSGGSGLPEVTPTVQRDSPSPVPPAPTSSAATPTPGNGGGNQGQQLAQQNGCTACHSIDGSAGIGPSWQGLFGKTETLNNGSTVQVDEAYLQESIVEPGAKIVQGFGNIMPSFARLSQEEVDALIEYIKTLQ